MGTQNQEIATSAYKESWAVKLFRETCCVGCSMEKSEEKKLQYESSIIYAKDNMGRDIFWDDMGTY